MASGRAILHRCSTFLRRGLATATAATIVSRESVECTGGEDQDPRLLKVAVVFRHGARTPVFTHLPGLDDLEWNVCSPAKQSSLPTVEVFDHASLAKNGPRPPLSSGVKKQVNHTLPGGSYAGQLSDLGIDQTEALGKMLREEYGRYLSPDATNGFLSVRSTNVPRCIASAQGVLMGLYPGHDSRQSPFRITTMNSQDEYLTPNTRKCQRMAELWNGARAKWSKDVESGEVPDALAIIEDLKTAMGGSERAAKLLEKFECPPNYIPIRDMVVAIDAHKLAGPGWMYTHDFLQRLDRLGARQIGALMAGPGGWQYELETNRLAMGQFMGEILKGMETTVEAREDLKGYKNAASSAVEPPAYASIDLFSAHDTTLVPMLTALGSWDGDWPTYASYLAFELWSGGWSSSGKSEPRVRVIYNGKPVDIRSGVGGVGGAGSKGSIEGSRGIWEVEGVTLSEYKKAMELLIPNDLASECLPRYGYTPGENWTWVEKKKKQEEESGNDKF